MEKDVREALDTITSLVHDRQSEEEQLKSLLRGRDVRRISFQLCQVLR